MPVSADPTKHIDAKTLMRIKSLDLRARRILEGYTQGLHRSPYHGSSVEFSEYRAYSEGDDPKHIDWKLYARSDRYCIKKYEAETNLICHLVVDQSRSMEFSTLDYTKADYASTLAATFAQFLFSQGDSVGIVTFADEINTYVPPRRRRGQMHQMVVALETEPKSTRTDIKKSLGDMSPMLRKRGLVVILSDLLEDIKSISSQITYLRSCGHDVIVFQILDPAEARWTFKDNAVFEDMETGDRFLLDPERARAHYEEQFGAHQAAVEKLCAGLGIDLVKAVTDAPFDQTLHRLLSLRSQLNRSRRGA
ncbi:MAG: DUF58 domain-containing protein [Verrucomicrobiaceae bacterium]|nr:DUF58 domain-containing protein [Verrucomicrobiaceae bacterium]